MAHALGTFFRSGALLQTLYKKTGVFASPIGARSFSATFDPCKHTTTPGDRRAGRIAVPAMPFAHTTMRILIAEDDSILADGLVRSLRQSGYAVDHVRHGVDADNALSLQTFDLLILDLGLPMMSGLEVLRRLRARNSQMPVLILTAADSVDERVKGLDLGADDYMAKPFALNELEARVRALTRRGAGGGPTVVRPGWPDRLCQRAGDRPVGARTWFARSAAAADRPAGVEGTARRPSVRMGEESRNKAIAGLGAPLR